MNLCIPIAICLSVFQVDIGEVVSLNVGGVIHWTTLTTLRKYRGTMLYSMFSGRHALIKDANGHYFLDRSGRMFGYVLSFLRCLSPPLSLPLSDEMKCFNNVLGIADCLS